MTDDELVQYLSSHLAGAQGGRANMAALVESLDSPQLLELVDELDSEMKSVAGLIAELQGKDAPVHGLLEKVQTFVTKGGTQLVSLSLEPDVATIVRLELMMGGVHAKRAMWTLLGEREMQLRFAPVRSLPLDAMIERAENQVQILEQHRRAVAAGTKHAAA